MHYGNIKPFTIENGEGVRVSLFVSGCRNHCKGCFQPETWDFNYGKCFDDETLKTLLKLLSHERVSGLSILGGEPFEPENQPTVLNIMQTVKKEFPTKTIWIYTGNVLETDLQKGKNYVDGTTDKILALADVLVDGPFVESLKNLSLQYRGSSNQRVLHKGKDF